MARLTRRALVAGGLAAAGLSACANGQSEPQEQATVIICGRLTLKDSEPGVWWAVTDDGGRVWKIASPTPEQVPILERVQNQRVTVQGRPLGKDLDFEQIKLLRIIVKPNF